MAVLPSRIGRSPLAGRQPIRYPLLPMHRFGSCRAFLRGAAVLSWLALALAPVELPAQEPGAAREGPGARAAEAAAPVAPAVIPAAEVAVRSAELDALLRGIRGRAGEVPAVSDVRRRLASAEESWRRSAAEAMARLQQPSPGSVIAELALSWSERERLAREWNRVLTGRIQQLAADVELLDQREALWRRTLDRAREDALPREVVARISEALEAIAEARERVRLRRNDLLTVQSRIAEQQQIVRSVLDAREATRLALRGNLWRRDAAPLWRVSAEPHATEALRQLASAWSRDLDDLRTLVLDDEGALANVALAFLALLAALVFLRRRARVRVGSAPELEATLRVLSRPGSAAFLVLILLLPALLPAAPRLVRLGMGLVLVVPVVRLIAPLASAALRRPVLVLVAWYLLDWLRTVVEPAAGLSRLLLLVESLASAALLGWLLRPSRLTRLREVTPWLRALGLAARSGLVLLSIAVVANVVGNLSLAELLTEGTLFAAYLAVVLYGSGRVLLGIWSVLLQMKPLRLSRAVQHQESLLLRRGARALEVGLALLWGWAVLARFDVDEPVFAAAESVLSASWPLGDVELVLGDVVAFGLTIWLAFLLSRLVRFVLDEDVLPRASLPRGVPYAVSSSVNYVILLLGFVLAVSAAGFDMSRFVLLVGALGVGIGIGLQDVVNNFVSGLILLFERPVQTGDVVELGELSGEVRRIGMRSSTVRTWDGAEVIVPNSKLVSDPVINWTLSDRLRRVTIPIGVAYGSDPEQVLRVLMDVAQAHPDVLAAPEPMALFVGHGESSLDFELRAWTGRFDAFLRVRSQLTVALNGALREAGLEIPFPQRDLHLRSADPSLSGLLDRDPRR